MVNKVIDFFFDEEEQELIKGYSFLLKAFVVSAAITMILIIM